MFRRILYSLCILFLAVISNAVAETVGYGDLDTTFNPPNGYVIYDGAAHGHDYGHAVAVQPDGMIVVAGSEEVDHPELGSLAPAILVLRYTNTGVLDPGFGNNGVFKDVITKVGDVVYALAVQPDGKIIFGGDSGANEEAFVGRLNSNGTLDTSFGASLGWTNGYYKINYSGSPAINGYTRFAGMALQSDGKIILAVNVFSYQTRENAGYVILRRNSDGTPDITFGADGAVYVDHDYVTSLAIQGDGKIVLAGYTKTAVDPNNYDVLLIRLESNGILDATFGSGGIVIKDLSPDDGAIAIAIQQDGKIVVAGYTTFYDVYNALTLFRFNSNGDLDDSFGTGGVVIDNDEPFTFPYSLAIQDNGKIVGTGLAYDQFFAFRFFGNGLRDYTLVFGGNSMPPALGVGGGSIALQADGKIIIPATWVPEDWVPDLIVLRLPGDPPPETIIDNRDANTSRTGTWYVSDAPNPYGADSLWSRNGSTFTWKFTPSRTGTYDLSMWWTQWASRSANIPVDIQYDGGTTRVYINQQTNGGS